MPKTAPQRLSEISDETSQFINLVQDLNDLPSLTVAMGQMTRTLGFDVFVLGQLPSTDYDGTNFVITNYPDGWRKIVYTRLKFGSDPVIDALADAAAPFLWEEAAGYKNPTPRQKAYLEAAEKFGLSRGYAVPIKVPGEPVGVVSFATKANAPVDKDMLPFTAYIATAAYRRVRDVVIQTRAQQREQIALSELEIRVLRAVAKGNPNFTISRDFGLAASELDKTLKSIHAKLGYSNRVSMAIRGIQLGYVTFNEALVG